MQELVFADNLLGVQLVPFLEAKIKGGLVITE